MDEEETETSGPVIDGVLLMRLRDCATSSKLGMIDQGFPKDMGVLHSMGYIDRVGNGYRINAAGLEFMRLPAVKQQLKGL